MEYYYIGLMTSIFLLIYPIKYIETSDFHTDGFINNEKSLISIKNDVMNQNDEIFIEIIYNLDRIQTMIEELTNANFDVGIEKLIKINKFYIILS